MPSATPAKFRFGSFELDAATGELRKSGVLLKLQPQPFRVLELLVKRTGQLVTREEIQHHLWKDSTFVDFEHGINFSINQIRAVLADNAEKPRYVETLPRRGYRFIGTVEPAVDRPSTAVEEKQRGTQSAKAASAKSARWRMAVGALCSALVIALAGLIISRIVERSRSTVEIRSVAVLPLENVSGNTAEDYFVDGMTDDLITELGQIHELRVISRTSVMQYKGVRKSLPQIAQELKVDAILEGTVMRSGERIRITAQLIQASPEKHLWAESYQRELRDVIGLQNDIARAIAQHVQATVTPLVQMQARNQRTISPEAYEAYWRGEFLLDKLQPDSVQKAAEYFQEAIKKSPDYVAAYNKLAGSYGILGNMGVLPKKEAQSRVEMLTARALEIDPLSGPAHAQKGWDALDNELDFTIAGVEFRNAVELAPNGVEGHEGLADNYAAIGQTDKAVLEIRRAQEVDPLSFIVNDDVCRMLYFARRFDEALAQCRATLGLDPALGRPLWQIAHIYVAKGMDETAASVFLQAFEKAGFPSGLVTVLKTGEQKAGFKGLWLAMLRTNKPDINDKKLDPFYVAVTYIYAGNKDKALVWLERAFEERSFGIAYLGVDPKFDSLHSDPRFNDLMGRMNSSK